MMACTLKLLKAVINSLLKLDKVRVTFSVTFSLRGLSPNIRSGENILIVTNILAYFGKALITAGER